MIERVYKINPECERTGEHIFPYDETFPICMRDGCEEGYQMADYYSDLEDEMCTCDEDSDDGCGWHGGRSNDGED